MAQNLTMEEAIRNATKVSKPSDKLPTGAVNIAKPVDRPVVKAVEEVKAVPLTLNNTITGGSLAAPSTTPILTLAALEKLYILDVLQKTGNNKTKAAELLGVSLKTIYNKLATYGKES